MGTLLTHALVLSLSPERPLQALDWSSRGQLGNERPLIDAMDYARGSKVRFKFTHEV